MEFRSRPLARDEQGFTLIELLVVILIIGILAVIALPSFLNQKSKATDAAAKELAHTEQIAAETYATDSAGGYAGLTLTILSQYESTIQTASDGSNAYATAPTNLSPTSYTVTASDVNSAETFSITRNNDGSISRSCTPATGVNGGCNNGSW